MVREAQESRSRSQDLANRAAVWLTAIALAGGAVTLGYVRLAGREEREVRVEFGEAYARCAAATPAFPPRLRRAPARRRA